MDVDVNAVIANLASANADLQVKVAVLEAQLEQLQTEREDD